MKAFGYTNVEVGAHYFKLVLAIAVGGALAGCLMGIAGGRALIDVYIAYFKFPFLVFQLDPASFVTGVVGQHPVGLGRRAAGVAPGLRADARRPRCARPPRRITAAPGGSGAALNRLLDQPSRMVLRRITRQPGRMAGSMIGIACGHGAVSVSMMTIYAGFRPHHRPDLHRGRPQRRDRQLHPAAVSDKTLFELRRMPGVDAGRAGAQRARRPAQRAATAIAASIIGLPPDAASQPRARRRHGADHHAARAAIVLSTALAGMLDDPPRRHADGRGARRPPAGARDPGRRRSPKVLLGSPAYMDLAALNRALREPSRVSGAYLSIDQARADEIYAALQDMPTVAGRQPQIAGARRFPEGDEHGRGRDPLCHGRHRLRHHLRHRLQRRAHRARPNARAIWPACG